MDAATAAALNPQEHKVAERVADGLTNEEIAGALRMSPKTVETHLTHIYRKLEVRSRVELALLVACGDRSRRRRK
jgi:DNA-binding CsgD family transcriptional regulator